MEEAGFAALGLDPRLVSALTALGYEEPTPIQRETIPPLILGKDLLGQAATGTGKTAAFALPILQRIINEGKGSGPVAVVLVPTRELAMQVSEAVHRYGKGGDFIVTLEVEGPAGKSKRDEPMFVTAPPLAECRKASPMHGKSIAFEVQLIE